MEQRTIQLPRISSQKQHQHYCKESMAHPAKMAPMLAQWILKRYTKAGDTVLDPMAGIGTTLVEAALLGRNAVGVEYEQSFVDLAHRNIDGLNVLGTLRPRGHARVLQGDSRELSNILIENVDMIAFSPPYANSMKPTYSRKQLEQKSKRFDELFPDKRNYFKEILENPDCIARGGFFAGYSKDKNNIGNLSHGSIDSIVTSPPFEGTEPFHDKDFALKNSGKIKFMEKAYTENKGDKNQIATLKGKNYLTEMLKIYEECFKVLRANGLMVLHTKNFVRGGKQVRLDEDTTKLCESAGFKKIDHVQVKLPNYSFWILNARKKFYKKNPGVDSRDPFAYFEDVQVFEKGGN